MRALLVLLSLVVVGCAGQPLAAPLDNFGIVEVDGVEITYPVGGGINPMKGKVFHLHNFSVLKRRLYVNGAVYRTLKRGDRLKFAEGNNVLLNGRLIHP